VHGTAAELYAILRNDAAADQHRASSRATILRLADSLPHDEPLRARFLSAPAVRRIYPLTGDLNTVAQQRSARSCRMTVGGGTFGSRDRKSATGKLSAIHPARPPFSG